MKYKKERNSFSASNSFFNYFDQKMIKPWINFTFSLYNKLFEIMKEWNEKRKSFSIFNSVLIIFFKRYIVVNENEINIQKNGFNFEYL